MIIMRKSEKRILNDCVPKAMPVMTYFDHTYLLFKKEDQGKISNIVVFEEFKALSGDKIQECVQKFGVAEARPVFTPMDLTCLDNGPSALLSDPKM